MYVLLFTSLLILVLLLIRNNYGEDVLTGFWMAEGDKFCEEADITSFLLFIGKPTGTFYTHRECYLVISDDVTNQPIKMDYTAWKEFGCTHTINFKCTMEDQIWPENLTAQINIIEGSLVIKCPKTGEVYARLFKRNDL